MNKIAILGSGKSAKNFVKAINKSSKFKLIQIGSEIFKQLIKYPLLQFTCPNKKY